MSYGIFDERGRLIARENILDKQTSIPIHFLANAVDVRVY